MFDLADSPLNTQEIETNELSAYPNPFSTSISLTNLNGDQTDITIYDLQGRLVHKQRTANELLNLEFLESGTYLLKISSDSETKTLKIVKQ